LIAMSSQARKRYSNPILSDAQRAGSTDLQFVESLTRLLDTKFRIPGTSIRFGADFILGLVPGAGDLVAMGFSGVLVAIMAKNGASARLVIRMLGNVVLDAAVGSVPILGNVFDLFYKANYRNLRLMQEHYHEGKHVGSVWPLVLAVIAFFVVTIVLGLLLVAFILRAVWNSIVA